MQFGQLIEYNMRNIFVEKSYTKCAGESILRPLSKKSKLSCSLAADDDFVMCQNVRVDKCLCCQADV